jgi:hypothetical protein
MAAFGPSETALNDDNWRKAQNRRWLLTLHSDAEAGSTITGPACGVHLLLAPVDVSQAAFDHRKSRDDRINLTLL